MSCKHWVLAALMVAVAMPASAEPKKGAKPPELEGVASARPGVKAERFVFEYFQGAPDGVFNAVRVTIEPGGSIPMHSHSGPEFHVVMNGELEETVQGQSPRTLKVGEWHFVPGGTAHGLTNKTKAPASFIAVIAGKKGERLTMPFKK